MRRRLTLATGTALAAGCLALLSACAGDGGAADPECVPSCETRSCGSDGCGGSCGSCDDGEQCDAAGRCAGATCDASCSDLGWECGETCGQSCGSCAQSERCHSGTCQCLPDCGAGSCGQPDGCGGNCACSQDLSCTDCPLSLRVERRDIEDGLVRSVELVVALADVEAQVRPTLADIRIAADQPVTLLSASTGDAAVAAGKDLYRFTPSGRSFRLREDGSYQLFLMSRDSRTLGPGEQLRLRFDLAPEANRPQGAVSFWLQRRGQVLAPRAADVALQATDYDGRVTVPLVSDAD